MVAGQLYSHLSAKAFSMDSSAAGSEFYISVPNALNRKARLREDGSFTYEYKYGRQAGDIQEYVKVVPVQPHHPFREISCRAWQIRFPPSLT
ncbi:MAG: hypothetical protein MZV63_00840 [Marinilabiliales bacterium]|nr:hypothetical protein [Marinilabiliales bacterium]